MPSIDYDALTYEREEGFERATAALIASLTDAMREGEVTNTPLRFEWAICDGCHGDGSHSRHLGIIRVEEWDEEEFDDYLDGRYDTTCAACNGTGKVRELDESTLPAEVVSWIEQYREDAYESASLRYHERLAGC